MPVVRAEIHVVVSLMGGLEGASGSHQGAEETKCGNSGRVTIKGVIMHSLG